MKVRTLIRPVSLLVLLAGLTLPAFGQAAMELSLEQAIQLARESSPGAKMARQDYDAVLWSYRATRARFRPTLSLQGSAPGLERSISDIVQDDGSVRYVSQSRTFSSVRLQVDQEIPLTGGRIYANSALNRVDMFGGRQSSNQWGSSPLVIGLRQPIFRFNEAKWTQRMEPVRFRAARRAFAEELVGVEIDVATRYFDVYVAKLNADIARFNVAVNDTIYTLSKGRYDLGKIAENDLLQSELQLLNARTDLAEAQIAYERALQDLKIALDLPYDREVAITAPSQMADIAVDANAAVDHARKNRSVYITQQIEALTADRNVAQAKTENSFSADLTASYGLNQSAGSLNDAYANLLNQERLSIGFSMPIFQWGRGKAQYESAMSARERTRTQIAQQIKEVEQEVYFEALQFSQLQAQVRLAAKADTIGTRRFEVARNRYTIGKIDITDLFDAQLAKDNASRAYIQTLRQYFLSYYRLRRLTLYDFQQGREITAEDGGW